MEKVQRVILVALLQLEQARVLGDYVIVFNFSDFLKQGNYMFVNIQIQDY